MNPVFNQFVRWLSRQRPRPLLVWILADSSTFGQKIPFWRRFRYAFKPMVTLEDARLIPLYDACISFSIGTRQFFEPRGVPWMWMPSAFNFPYEPPPAEPNRAGPIEFGYFGVLARPFLNPLLQAFLGSGVSGTLQVCGYGDFASELEKRAQRHPNFRFDGLLPKQSDCLDWAQQVDVLVNPRPPVCGYENTFPSKIFEFAMTGKAILTTRTGGVDTVMGEEGIYVETDNFEEALRQKLIEVAAMERAELQRLGAALRQRILKEYNWDEQARRIIDFLAKILDARRSCAKAHPSGWS